MTDETGFTDFTDLTGPPELSESTTGPPGIDPPACPVHGKMTWQQPGCDLLCVCRLSRWTCGGWEGGGCAHTVSLIQLLSARKATGRGNA